VANNGHTIMASYPPGRSIAVDGETYELLQFHLHAPSEHTVDGVPAAAELHLVHQADDETLAVVAVLIEEGAAEPDVASMMEQVPAVEGEEVDPGAVDPLALLPDTRSTWRYDGSLTTPPCSEGVKWMVMAEPVTWSADQIAAFTELYDGSARPVQPLNDREPVLDATG
jgi:carbonic anhydrase